MKRSIIGFLVFLLGLVSGAYLVTSPVLYQSDLLSSTRKPPVRTHARVQYDSRSNSWDLVVDLKNSSSTTFELYRWARWKSEPNAVVYCQRADSSWPTPQTVAGLDRWPQPPRSSGLQTPTTEDFERERHWLELMISTGRHGIDTLRPGDTNSFRIPLTMYFQLAAHEDHVVGGIVQLISPGRSTEWVPFGPLRFNTATN
jgi:hypothetical protein